jgi:hypothetical protein
LRAECGAPVTARPRGKPESFLFYGARMFAITESRLLLAAALAIATAGVAPLHARTLEVGTGKKYTMPSEAINDAHERDRILIAPGKYFDCALVRTDHLVIEGASADGSAVLTDKACGGKALLVISGNDVTVRNLTLTRARVPDFNGAGIRVEGNKLTVEGVHFINNQDGILGGAKGATVIVRNSEFVKNGVCAELCAHGIYVGEIDLLRVEHSRFFDTRQGHHIKSRALRTEVLDSDIQDGPDGTASYLIDVPNGGSTIVRGNTMEKGPKNENHSAAISIGEEGITHETGEITVENNRFTNDGPATYFVRNLTATEAKLKGNHISGPMNGVLQGDGSSE